MDIASLAVHKVNLKETATLGKYLNHRKLKKLWNLKKTTVPFIIGLFETTLKKISKISGILKTNGKLEIIQMAILAK